MTSTETLSVLLVDEAVAEAAAAGVEVEDPALLGPVERGRVHHGEVLGETVADVEALRGVRVVGEQRAVGGDVDEDALADALLEEAAEGRGQLLGHDHAALRRHGRGGAAGEEEREEVGLREVRAVGRVEGELEVVDPAPRLHVDAHPADARRALEVQLGGAPGVAVQLHERPA